MNFVLLFIGFTSFLFELDDENSEDGVNKMAICNLLVQRCDDISDELSLVTLHLFLRMLLKRDIRVVQTLVLRHNVSGPDSDDVIVSILRQEMKKQAERYILLNVLDDGWHDICIIAAPSLQS